MDDPTARGAIDIDAPPELVYELVSDVTTLPDWAAETDRCRWLGGATGPAVGARFRGRNRYRGRQWSTTCKVVAADPGRRFAFDVTVLGRTTARWEYEIEPRDGGCRVTESTRRSVPRPIAVVANTVLGISDRDAHNLANIERTLSGLKEHAEARARA